MSLCGKHSSHRMSNGARHLLGGVKGEIHDSAELEVFLWRLSFLIQVLQEVSLESLEHSVQGSTSLTCCHVGLAHRLR